ncbi:hypothetical protein F8O53_12415 [Enterobacter sp. 63]
MSESLKDESNSIPEASDLNKDLKDVIGVNGDKLKKEAHSKIELLNQSMEQEKRKKKIDAYFISILVIYGGLGFVYANVKGIPLSFLFGYYWPSMLGVIMMVFGIYYLMRRTVSLSNRSRKKDFVDVDYKYTEFTDDRKNDDKAYAVLRKINKELVEKLKGSDNIAQEKRDNVENILKQTITTLEQKANAADEKASLLLQRGVSYTKFGIGFYLLSILIWQVTFVHYGFRKEHLYGILSCSFLFLFIEFLSAWFLKQYKNFTDNSVYLLKIKSFFDKFLIVYSIESKEDSDANGSGNSYEKTIALLSKDLIWPDVSVIESKEASFAKDTISSISDLINAVNKKEDKEKSN